MPPSNRDPQYSPFGPTTNSIIRPPSLPESPGLCQDNELSITEQNAVDPVLNQLSAFFMSRTVRNTICQRRSTIDFDEIVNGGKILSANLSTGQLTENTAGTLGSIIVTKIVNVAFRRANIPEEERRPWYLYVDEFQAFMNLPVGFDRILAEARKYRLILAGLANQYVGQLSSEVRQAIFGNVGVMVVFRLGVGDAESVSREMGVFTGEEILNLERGEAIARAGGSATAFNIRTAPPSQPPEVDPTHAIVMHMRAKYARPRAEVERELAEPPSNNGTAPSQPSAGRRRPRGRGGNHQEPGDRCENDLVS